jgi:primosomal protein N' (replication factor Y)
LNIPDFRSAERTYSLLNQVAGRAGRASKEGRVIIQGFNLNHYSIQEASKHNYEAYYNEELNVRRVLKYPPFYNLTIIKIISTDYDMCVDESNKIYQYLKDNLSKYVIVLGPSNDIFPRINNKFYMQITLKYKNTDEVLKALKFLQANYRKNNKVSIDIDLSA